MNIMENVLLRPKTTMRIGGTARYFAEVRSREDVEGAVRFAAEKGVKLIPLGSGSNTIFSREIINAFVIQMKAEAVKVEGGTVTVGAGKNLPMLINELATEGLDLSALTGIPGSVGGAVFGNAGQGPGGVWISNFIASVTVFMDGSWKVMEKDACGFMYRESIFKHRADGDTQETYVAPVIYEVSLAVPSAEPSAIKKNIEQLLQKRIETQPHLKTAGSCFKACGDIPAWKLIDAAGLRGYRVGGVQIAEKHANFLLNVGDASYQDAVLVVEHVKKSIPKDLQVEMRFIEPDGSGRF
jgi:UDP-N-acetylmuramate dehydrogenase